MYAPTQSWDLERFYASPDSPAFQTDLDACFAELRKLLGAAQALPPLADGLDSWQALIRELEEAGQRMADLGAYAACWVSAHTADEAARLADVRCDELRGLYYQTMVPITAGLGEADEASFAALQAALPEWAPSLAQTRGSAKLKLEKPLQDLLAEIDREALHGWGQLYDMVSGRLEAPLTIDGTTRTAGIAEIASMRSHPSEAARRAAFEASATAWTGIQDICAACLTHLTGARQTRQKRVGIDDLAQPLHSNRTAPAVLDAMWEATTQMRPSLVRYLEAKARLLGKPRLDWYDVPAPVGSAEVADISWERAQTLVVEAFEAFDAELGAFARRALSDSWVEAEARSGKRQGGFCAGFRQRRESRIFMTFSGSVRNTLTLAHELGHAWHNEVLGQAHPARRRLTMSLAETASTFAEAIVRDRLLASATNPELERFLLDQQLQAGVSFLMDIPARFAFERRLYTLREQGALSARLLCSEMVALQKEAYGDALASWNPTFWASKLHFYIAAFGFYNWPYTFGYLFSGAIYARAVEEGPAFGPKLRELLLRTGWQDSQGIARDVLGEDLTDPAFWVQAAEPLETMLTRFEALSEG